MPIRWKIFKAIAVLQLIFVTFKAFTSFAGLFFEAGLFFSILDILTYGLMLAFVTLGFSVVNYNFPETPLSVSRKRWFNYLFLLNFLLVAVLFAKAINEWELVGMFNAREFVSASGTSKIYYYFLLAHNTLIFLLHLYFLYSMYRLRKEIYSNSEEAWVREFNPDSHGRNSELISPNFDQASKFCPPKALTA